MKKAEIVELFDSYTADLCKGYVVDKLKKYGNPEKPSGDALLMAMNAIKYDLTKCQDKGLAYRLSFNGLMPSFPFADAQAEEQGALFDDPNVVMREYKNGARCLMVYDDSGEVHFWSTIFDAEGSIRDLNENLKYRLEPGTSGFNILDVTLRPKGEGVRKFFESYGDCNNPNWLAEQLLLSLDDVDSIEMDIYLNFPLVVGGVDLEGETIGTLLSKLPDVEYDLASRGCHAIILPFTDPHDDREAKSNFVRSISKRGCSSWVINKAKPYNFTGKPRRDTLLKIKTFYSLYDKPGINRL